MFCRLEPVCGIISMHANHGVKVGYKDLTRTGDTIIQTKLVQFNDHDENFKYLSKFNGYIGT